MPHPSIPPSPPNPPTLPPPHHVARIGRPLLEYSEGEAGVEHPRRGKHYHGAGVVHVRLVEGFDVLEVEHVAMDEGAADLLIGPRDKHAVVLVGLGVKAAVC